MKGMKNSFILYFEQGEQIGMLTDAEAGKLIKALFRFAETGEGAPLENGMTKMCFSFISAQIARDSKAYEEKCKSLSQNAKKTNASKSHQLQANDSKCKQLAANEGDTDTDTVTDTVSVSDTESDTESVTEYGTVTEYENDATAANATEPAPPCAPRACPTAPPMSEEERDRLISKGIPSGYVDERRERANAYAAQHGTTAYDTLLDWWKADRAQPPWNRSQTQYARHADCEPTSSSQFSTSSFDTDDFFQAALARSWQRGALQ